MTIRNGPPVPRRDGQPYTAAEDAVILQTKKPGEAALLLGRTYEAIAYRKGLLRMNAQSKEKLQLRRKAYRKTHHVRILLSPEQAVVIPEAVLLERARRLAAPHESLTSFICGDPRIGYRALDRKPASSVEPFVLAKTYAKAPTRVGSMQRAAKISERDVAIIVSRFDGGERRVAIAADYGISPVTISMIIQGKAWRHANPKFMEFA